MHTSLQLDASCNLSALVPSSAMQTKIHAALLACLISDDFGEAFSYTENATSYIDQLTDDEVKVFIEHFQQKHLDVSTEACGQALGEAMLYTLLSATSIVRFNPEFSAFKFSLKTLGSDLGFILTSPDQNIRYFVKRPKRLASDFFNYLCLAYLGTKAPEVKVIKDMGQCEWLATRDMSRTYFKLETIKNKGFKSLEDLFSDCPHRLEKKSDRSCHQLFAKEIIHKYLQSSATKTKNSFVKTMMLAYILELEDVFNHYGNIGLVSKDKQSKFAVIDLSSKAKELTAAPSYMTKQFYNNSLATIYEDAPSFASDFFPQLFKEINQADLNQALGQIAHPTKRTYTAMGELISEKHTTTFEAVIAQVSKEFCASFAGREADCQKLSERLLQRFDTFKEYEQYES